MPNFLPLTGWPRALVGALRTALAWAVAWAVGGVLIGVTSLLTPFLPWHRFFAVYDAPLPTLAIPGFVAGLGFALASLEPSAAACEAATTPGLPTDVALSDSTIEDTLDRALHDLDTTRELLHQVSAAAAVQHFLDESDGAARRHRARTYRTTSNTMPILAPRDPHRAHASPGR